MPGFAAGLAMVQNADLDHWDKVSTSPLCYILGYNG